MNILAWFGRFDTNKREFEPFASLDQRVQALITGGACPNDQYLREFAKSTGFSNDDAEYNAQVCETAIAIVKMQLRSRATEEADLLKAAGALNDLDSAINHLNERLFEWSRLHTDEIIHGEDLAASLQENNVMGELARLLIGLRASRQRFEGELGDMATKLAPNLAMLAGPILAARLISRSGGLKNLANMPSSAIQIIGAEKALFKHLKGKAPSPKHGLIYRHPAVYSAPWKSRGKIARALACKLTIAARLDFYGGDLKPELKESLERRMVEIGRKKKGPSSKQ